MLTIGPIISDSPFVLAPLAGYTDLPFRLLCKTFGAGYTVSEMISCHGLVYGQPRTLEMLASIEEEKPVSFQLFGAEPDVMAEAAALLASRRPDMIDINMGCPVKKVTKRGAGAALMSTPERAEAIIKGVVNATDIPVTVKIRSGRDQQNINAVEFARMVEGCGAAALTIHGRTFAQGFSGTVDWDTIKAVKESVSIPVIGNGDIKSRQEAYGMMEYTGCDGVMIGRAALGSPWIFSTEQQAVSPHMAIDTCRKHLELMQRYLQAPERRLGYIKSHLCRYFKGWKGCSRIRSQIFSLSGLDELSAYLETLTAHSAPPTFEAS